jgi:hypothetical protein
MRDFSPKKATKHRPTSHQSPLGTEGSGLGNNRQIAPAYRGAKRHTRFNFAEKPNARCPNTIKHGTCGLTAGTKKATESRS